MKKVLLISVICIFLGLLSGCGNLDNSNSENPILNTGFDTDNLSGGLGNKNFLNASNFSNEFVAYLQTFNPDTLPKVLGEIYFGDNVSSPIRNLIIKPSDFKTFTGEVDNKDGRFVLIFWYDYPVGIYSFYDFKSSFKIGEKNEQGFNDVYVRKNYSWWLNFEEEPITQSGILIEDIILYNDDEYLVEKVIENEYPKFLLKKNNTIIDESESNDRFSPLVMSQDDKLIYIKYNADGDHYSDYNISLIKEGGEIINTWTGNFLTSDAYSLDLLPDGEIAIGRKYSEYPDDIRESIPTITDEILENIQEQEKTILKWYRLIDQKKFKEAYDILDNPPVSLQEFTEQWNKYNLVSVNDISTPKIFFDSYPEIDKSYLKGLGNLNMFDSSVFVRDLEGEYSFVRNKLQVLDNKKIKLYSHVDNGLGYVRGQREQLTRLYYNLIATHRFQEAYDMQYDHPKTLEEFSGIYKDVLGISIKQLTDMEIEESGFSSSSKDDPDEGASQILLDFIMEDSVERYYVEKEIIGGKLKHLSSERTDKSCVTACGYGYKPIIYLYPQQETDIEVKLPIRGEFIVTYPEISEDNSRSVTAQPDGKLFDKADGREYSYLFWEGKFGQSRQIDEGFVVKGEDTLKFLQEKLEYLGLTPKEYNEFIVYRWPLMKDNKRNLISFLKEEYTSKAPLIIDPKPDSVQRVFMVFKGLDKSISIPVQKLEPFQRSGFSVIEWGGSEIY